MKGYRFWLIVLFPVVLYLGTIWQRPLFLPDEMRYSEIPREMIASGSWISPQLNGMDYFEKPVLGYWLIAGAMKLFGERPAAVRFPSAVATLLSAGVIWLVGMRAGDRRLGTAAAAVFLFSGLVFAVGTYGVLDAPFSFFLWLTMGAAYFACTEKISWKRAGYLCIAGIGCGLAFLTKGFLAVVLPTLAMVFFLIWERSWKRIFTLPWIPLLVAAAVAAPWVIVISRMEPDFWRQFIWVEHFQRAISGMGANDDRREPFWYFLPVLAGGVMPWLLFLPAVWRGYRRHVREFFRLPLLRFSVSMLLTWFVFFSVSRGKLATYILPCFPAISFLIAFGLLRAEEAGDYGWADRVLRFLIRVLLAVPILLFLVQTLDRFSGRVPADLVLYRFNENYFIPILAMMMMMIWFQLAVREFRGERKFFFFCIGLGFVMLAVHCSMPWRFIRDIAPEQFLKTVARPLVAGRSDVTVLADRTLGASACWSLKRADIGIYGRSGEFEYGLSQDQAARRWNWETLRQLHQQRKPFILITKSEKLAREVPSPKTSVRSGSLFVVACNLEEKREGK